MWIDISYPRTATDEPARLSRHVIGLVAAAARRRLAAPAPRPICLEALARRTARMNINGHRFGIAWDWDHAVHDAEGTPVLGACEYDPAEPETVMISLNGERLAHQPGVLLSTAAHELGHAIFDMPAMMLAARQRSFRLGGDAPPADEWREWRANEFMGEFLTPRRMLSKAFAREAGACGIDLHWRDIAGIPTPSIAQADPAAMESIIAALAEQFGVTAAFIATRCAKHGLIDRKKGKKNAFRITGSPPARSARIRPE